MKKSVYQLFLIHAAFLFLLAACTSNSVDRSPSKCLIVKQTTQHSTSSSTGKEIDIDGKKYTVSVTYDYAYKYDSENRLIQTDSYEYNRNPLNETYKYSYPHPDTLLSFYPNKFTSILNAQGAIIKLLGSTNQYVYDSDGFQTKLVIGGFTIKRTVMNENIVTEDVEYDGGRSVYAYEYDLTKQNLPTVTMQWGKQSKNLLVREKRVDYDSFGKPNPGNYIINYQYKYDQEGRVTRKYYQDPVQSTSIYVVDYQYQCQ
ncbi:hypothetical protein [Spirosoma pomorum]